MYDSNVEIAINATPERVWELVTDISEYQEMLSGVTEVEQLDSLPEFGVGTKWRETRKMFGKEATEEMTVTAMEPGASYTTEAASHGAKYVSVISIVATESGCTLGMSFRGEPTNIFASIMAKTVGRLFEGVTRNALQKDLDEIAAAATT